MKTHTHTQPHTTPTHTRNREDSVKRIEERRLYYEARSRFQEDLEADLNAELLFRKDQAQVSKAYQAKLGERAKQTSMLKIDDFKSYMKVCGYVCLCV